jgi:hypothetical protein
MPDETYNLLINALSGLAGAVIGATATLRSAARQHERDMEAERARESRLRSVKAAERCDELFTDLGEETARTKHTGSGEEMRSQFERIGRGLDEINRQMIHLPQPFKGASRSVPRR